MNTYKRYVISCKVRSSVYTTATCYLCKLSTKLRNAKLYELCRGCTYSKSI